MPAPRKVDLIPPELRTWLRETLARRGFGDFLAVTDELNALLEARGEELRLGRTAVAEYSKLLKDQREAFGMAETLLADMDVAAEGDLHRTLMQMIAASAMQMMRAVREEDGRLDPKDLGLLARMLKDLMGSAGLRETLLENERGRLARQAREAAAAAVETSSAELGLSAETVAAVKARILGVAA